jgi:3-deoxy-manno-octulosonate cytidylyltransferase (CMP-KDO synthetase)
MKFIGIIPARYESTRFPGKPLAVLGNKPLVQHVYERASEALENVFVATDDERIFEAVNSFGGKVVMTSPSHLSGTDRCAEEPFVRQGQIELLKNSFNDPNTDIATLVKKIDEREDIFDINKPKVTFDKNGYALFFTRSPIPFIRNLDKTEWPGDVIYYKHIGVYAYRSEVLRQITQLPPSTLEMAESLEQLRWLQNGYRIKVNITKYENMGIDTPEDLRKARELTENTSGA